jgi:hypothetical protein
MQVLQSATIIAKHTSVLCNSCRIASSKTTNAAAKRQFVQSAKDVANATSALVKRIRGKCPCVYLPPTRLIALMITNERLISQSWTATSLTRAELAVQKRSSL